MQGTEKAGQGMPVCRSDELDDGEAIVVSRETAGTVDDIVVFNDGGEFFALDDTCTHAQASLSEGWIDEGTVSCPMHNGVFCLRTGAAVTLPASQDVVAHQVEVRDGVLWLTPTTDLTN
jgi:3-phenylpropionate/trans-cinnamate dioxygenase ferredoxin subunit